MNPLKLLRPALALWCGMVVAAGLLLTRGGVPSLRNAVLWGTVFLVAEAFWVRTYGLRATISTAMVAHLAAATLVPVDELILLGFLTSFLADRLIQRKPTVKALYNASLVALTLWAMATVAAPARHAGAHHLMNSLWLLPAGLVYWVCNRSGVVAIVSLASGIPVGQAWTENFGFQYEWFTTAIEVVLAIGLVLAWPAAGPWALAGVGAVCHFINDAYRRRNTLEAFRRAETEGMDREAA